MSCNIFIFCYIAEILTDQVAVSYTLSLFIVFSNKITQEISVCIVSKNR